MCTKFKKHAVFYSFKNHSWDPIFILAIIDGMLENNESMSYNYANHTLKQE